MTLAVRHACMRQIPNNFGVRVSAMEREKGGHDGGWIFKINVTPNHSVKIVVRIGL